MMKHLKKLMICLLSSVSLVLSGCSFSFLDLLNKNEVEYEVTLSQKNMSLSLGNDPVQLLIEVKKDDVKIDNYEVNWSSKSENIATVDDNGYVVPISPGNAIITAKVLIPEENASFNRSCNVTVSEPPVVLPTLVLDPNEVEIDLNSSKKIADLIPKLDGNSISTSAVTYSTSDSSVATVGLSGRITAKSVGETIVKATLKENANITATCNVKVFDSSVPTISLDVTSRKVARGKTLKLNANASNPFEQNSELVWSGSANGITVDSTGLVSVSYSAKVGDTAIIKVEFKNYPDYFATCTITAKEETEYDYDYTLMYYMCASNLEHDSNPEPGYSSKVALYTSDIKELLSVSLGSSVKIIVETGGTKKWYLPSTYIDGTSSIRSDKLQRWEVINGKLHLVETLTTNQMASTASFKSFLNWGLDNYSAEQMAVIISGHGGGVDGCAYDDNYSSNSLQAREVADAAKDSLIAHGRDKFTWIGYDCCIMQTADVASVNADYFEYMVASQESEEGSGWDHDVYLKEIAKNPEINPENLFPYICDSFISQYCNDECGQYYPGYGTYYCYQTLSALDLSKMETFVNAFETFATSVGTSKSNFTGIYKNAFTRSLEFGEAVYGLVDMKDFINNVSTTVSKTTVLNALNDLIIYNKYCRNYKSTKPCGLNLFFAYSTDLTYGLQVGKTNYTSADSKFTNWQSMNYSYGEFY